VNRRSPSACRRSASSLVGGGEKEFEGRLASVMRVSRTIHRTLEGFGIVRGKKREGGGELMNILFGEALRASQW